MKRFAAIIAAAALILFTSSVARADTYAGITVGSSFADLQTLGTGADTTAINAGAFIGHEFKAGKFIVGAEADVTYDDVRLSATAGAGTITKAPGWTASLRARAGAEVTDKLTIYLTAGPAITEDYDIGLTFGGGAEVKLTDTIKLRGEARHTLFENINAGGIDLDYADTRFGVGLVFKIN